MDKQVLHPTQKLENKDHKVFAENYFMSYPLMQTCSNRCIWIKGTILINRFGKPPFSEEKCFRKNNRGHIEQIVSTDAIILVK